MELPLLREVLGVTERVSSEWCPVLSTGSPQFSDCVCSLGIKMRGPGSKEKAWRQEGMQLILRTWLHPDLIFRSFAFPGKLETVKQKGGRRAQVGTCRPVPQQVLHIVADSSDLVRLDHWARPTSQRTSASEREVPFCT